MPVRRARSSASATHDDVVLHAGSGAAFVEPADQYEAWEHGHEEQALAQQACTRDVRARRQSGWIALAGVARGRAAPHAAARDGRAVGQRQLAFQMAAAAVCCVPFQDCVRRHARVVVQRDLTEQEAAARTFIELRYIERFHNFTHRQSGIV